MIELLSKVKTPIVLAPMAEYTDAAMRKMCFDGGATWTVTEMVNAVGCVRGDPKTLSMLVGLDDGMPAVAQLYGNDPATLAEAARIVESTGRFIGIDLNAGCPVPRIRACGAGSALIETPSLIEKILSAMSGAVRLPVSLKTRLGPNPAVNTAFDLLKAAENGGAKLLCLHARFTSQGHGGATYWQAVAEVKAKAKIPVLGNGSITSVAQAKEIMGATGVDGVMIGRAALGNPGVFSGQETSAGKKVENLLRHIELQKRLIARQLEMSASTKSADYLLALAFRNHLFRYLSGIRGANAIRASLSSIDGERAIQSALRQLAF